MLKEYTVSINYSIRQVGQATVMAKNKKKAMELAEGMCRVDAFRAFDFFTPVEAEIVRENVAGVERTTGKGG